MIPYIGLHTITIGPITLQIWGLFVALGIGAATLYAGRSVRRMGLDANVIYDIAGYILIPALMMARLVHVFAYDPAMYMADPLAILRIWEGGASSIGGFIGAGLGIVYYAWRHKKTVTDMRPYLEALAVAFPLGYGIGRIGCFLIHDHPGIPCDCVIAVAYPDEPRLDHGLLLSVMGLCIFALFWVSQTMHPISKQRFRYLPVLLLIYGAIRFVLDMLRAETGAIVDARFAGMTPAQYGAIIMMICGALIIRHEKKRLRQS